MNLSKATVNYWQSLDLNTGKLASESQPPTTSLIFVD